MDRRRYIQTVTDQIRCKRALPLVTKELEDHIEDQKCDYMTEGMEPSEAEEAAVLEMGDPVEVGIEMARDSQTKNGMENDWSYCSSESGRNSSDVLSENKCPCRCGK